MKLARAIFYFPPMAMLAVVGMIAGLLLCDRLEEACAEWFMKFSNHMEGKP